MLPSIANRLRLPLAVQYAVFAPVVLVLAVGGGVIAACFIAWDFATDVYADIRDAHAASTTKGDGDGER